MRGLLELAVRLALAVTAVFVALDVLMSPSRQSPPRPLRRSRITRWALEAAALLTIAAVGGMLVVASGIVPIKASAGHWQITRWFLEFGMRRSIATHTIGMSVPPLDEPGLVLKGATHFDIGCRPCHGSPALEQPRIARHMAPHPPYLPPVLAEFDADELFYIVKHGVKLTGMPAWPAQQRDDEVWAVVAFLRRFPGMDAGTYERLVSGGTTATDAGAPIEDLLGAERVPRAITGSCARCHGIGGLGRAGAFPRIAGQRPDYLYASLRAYATGQRHSGIMEPIAAGLGIEELREVTRYYAGRLGGIETSGGSASSDVTAGEAIATRGLPDQLVPPCAKCHGPGGERHNPHYPALAGQYADYIALQLTLFRTESRGGTAYRNIMRKVAGQLTDEQVRAVARYYASLPWNAEGATP